MTYEFESLSYSEALKMADEGETWLVDNIIGSSTTLIYGEAKSGKSFGAMLEMCGSAWEGAYLPG